MAPPPRCARHPAALAGWACERCRASLCPHCVHGLDVRGTRLVACVRCGALAQPITIRRAEVASLPARLPGALLHPASGPVFLAATATVLAILESLGALAWLLAACVLWAVLGNVVVRTARGDDALEAPELDEVWSDVVRPGLHGLAAIAIVAGPAVAWAVGRLLEGELPSPAHPVPWLFVALGLLYAPAAFARAALGRSVLAMLDPVTTVRTAIRLGRAYLVTVAALVGLLALHGLAWLAADAVSDAPVPFLRHVAAEVVTLWCPLAMARTLGLLLYVHGDRVGGEPADYQVPVLPGAEPRGAPALRAALRG